MLQGLCILEGAEGNRHRECLLFRLASPLIQRDICNNIRVEKEQKLKFCEVALGIFHKVLFAFNGDIRLPFPVHIVTASSPRTRSEVIEMQIADAEGIMPFCASALPSKNRWGSCAHAMSRQMAGFLIHDLFRQTVRTAYSG